MRLVAPQVINLPPRDGVVLICHHAQLLRRPLLQSPMFRLRTSPPQKKRQYRTPKRHCGRHLALEGEAAHLAIRHTSGGFFLQGYRPIHAQSSIFLEGRLADQGHRHILLRLGNSAAEQTANNVGVNGN